jgi:hypothetical protein
MSGLVGAFALAVAVSNSEQTGKCRFGIMRPAKLRVHGHYLTRYGRDRTTRKN